MDLESFLAELRAAREAGVTFVLDRGRIRALGPVPPPVRCPLEVVCFRVTHRAAPYHMDADSFGMDQSLAEDIMWASDHRSALLRKLRARILEACGLAGKEGE